jgi:glycosyltransferase involved in cell wall biosynthesis
LSNNLCKTSKQETDNLFNYEIIVIDNDHKGSAKEIVSFVKELSDIPVTYSIETKQNIALARNRALELSSGDYIAFIDDDEEPIVNWLKELYKAIVYYKSAAVLGPVLPSYEIRPPRWVQKGRFFERPRFNSGRILDWEETRTGNVLIDKSILDHYKLRFDHKLGSGGEDRELFRNMIKNDQSAIWCDTAIVYEYVPIHRWSKIFMVKRAILRGQVAYLRRETGEYSLLKSFAAMTVYLLIIPFSFALGNHIFMKYLIKLNDHLGLIMASFGINIIKDKYLS